MNLLPRKWDLQYVKVDPVVLLPRKNSTRYLALHPVFKEKYRTT